MANRMLSFGYGIQDGAIAVIDCEARTVERIFNEYIDGSRLEDISRRLTAEGVEFYLGNCLWNKNRIARIIDNEKYIGADGYPQIINDDDFIYAKQLKESKGAKKIHFDETIEYLRSNKITCAQCGCAFRRVSKWRSREKWLCRHGCKNDIYVSDDVIFFGINVIIRRIIAQPDCILPETDQKKNNLEIKRYTNEVNRFFGNKNPSFGAGKSLIFRLAELKFEVGNEKTPDVYTDMLIADCRRVLEEGKADKPFLEKYCQEIRVETDGAITIKFINGVELSSKGAK